MMKRASQKFVHKLRSNRGFTLLLAIVVAGLVLTIGLALSLLSTKEFVLSGTNRDSQLAYYAASSGINCARKNVVSIQRGTSFTCNNQDVSYTSDGQGGGSFHFTLTPQPYYVEVTVKKSGGKYSAIAKGYNTSDSNRRRVERTQIADDLGTYSCFVGKESNNVTPFVNAVTGSETKRSPGLQAILTYLGDTLGYKSTTTGANLSANSDQSNFKYFDATLPVTMQVRYLGKGLGQTVDFGYYTVPDTGWHSLQKVTSFTCDPEVSPVCPVGTFGSWKEFQIEANTKIYFGFKTDILHWGSPYSGTRPTTHIPYLTGRFYSTDPTQNSNDNTAGETLAQHRDETSDLHIISYEATYNDIADSKDKPSFIFATEAMSGPGPGNPGNPYYVWDASIDPNPSHSPAWTSPGNKTADNDYNDVVYEVQFKTDCAEAGDILGDNSIIGVRLSIYGLLSGSTRRYRPKSCS
jgi:hypothetical protein